MNWQKSGCNVAFNYSKSDDLANKLVKEIEALGVKAMAKKVDVSDFEGAKEMVKEVKDEFGQIDILVNNAGITRDKLLALMKEDDWDDVININLKSVYNFSKGRHNDYDQTEKWKHTKYNLSQWYCGRGGTGQLLSF